MEDWFTETQEIWRIALTMESQQHVSNGAVGTWKRNHQKSLSEQLLFPDPAFPHQNLLAGQCNVLYLTAQENQKLSDEEKGDRISYGSQRYFEDG